jgi:hypothetical protein
MATRWFAPSSIILPAAVIATVLIAQPANAQSPAGACPPGCDQRICQQMRQSAIEGMTAQTLGRQSFIQDARKLSQSCIDTMMSFGGGFGFGLPNMGQLVNNLMNSACQMVQSQVSGAINQVTGQMPNGGNYNPFSGMSIPMPGGGSVSVPTSTQTFNPTLGSVVNPRPSANTQSPVPNTSSSGVMSNIINTIQGIW